MRLLSALIYISIAVGGTIVLLKKGQKYESAVFLGLTAIACFYTYNLLMEWDIPDPSILFSILLDPLSKAFFM